MMSAPTKNPELFSQYDHQSESYYIACALFIMLINFVVMCAFLAKKLRGSRGCEDINIILFSLTVDDLCYEATTTPLLMESAEKFPNAKNIRFLYLAFNISTFLHLLIELIRKLFAGTSTLTPLLHQISSSFASVVFTLSTWSLSFYLAYIGSKEDVNFIDQEALVLIGQFKTLGYYVFGIVLMSLGFMYVCGICCPQLRSFKAESSPVVGNAKNSMIKPVLPQSGRCQDDDLVVCCVCLSFSVVWLAWLVTVVDSSYLMSIELMKSFEVFRLAARILCPFSLFYGNGNADDGKRPCIFGPLQGLGVPA